MLYNLLQDILKHVTEQGSIRFLNAAVILQLPVRTAFQPLVDYSVGIMRRVLEQLF